jgi:cysteine desulfurase family protein (TIGR01976 family)
MSATIENRPPAAVIPGSAAGQPAWDVDAVRAHFPSLARHVRGRTVAYLDGPAGTQVPRECIDAVSAYFATSNANSHGAFTASRETDALLHDVHAASADFLGADDPDEVSFGPNMTTLTFAVSRAIGRGINAGDEIVVTRLDHDANVAPWLHMAEDRGATVRWVPITEECTLDMATLESVLSPRTRVVAVGLASNAVGSINPIPRIAELAHAVGAKVWVDAVHAGPHLPIDVKALDVDYLVCSAYKFYGPHLGILWGRRELLEALPAYKVRPADDALPHRFETGTQAFELLSGLLGTYGYLESIGRELGGAASGASRRQAFRAAMDASRAYERGLVLKLIADVSAIPGVRIRGITDPARVEERCPTIAFTVDGHHPRAVAKHLNERAVSVWDGDYYAWELMHALGLAESGGMVRVGLVHYNTAAEIDRLVAGLIALVKA